VTGETRVSELKDGLIRTYNFNPLDVIGEVHPAESLVGGDAEANARIVRAVLAGEPGPCRDVVVLNAAFAIVAGGKSGTVQEGAAVARECIDGGAAVKKLQALIEMSHA